MRGVARVKIGIGLVICLMFVGALSTGAAAQTLTGPEILEQVDATMHIEKRILTQTMLLRNERGQERERVIKTWNKYFDGEDHMLLRFLEPANVAGTGFLVEGDDMWLYLPALNNVRRIAGHAKNGNFMGSDLSYTDMERFGAVGFSEDYEATLTGEGVEANEAVYVLELTPSGDDVYTLLRLSVSQETYLPRRIEYYDGDGLVKTLTTDDIQQIEGRWTAVRMTMADATKGTSTTLVIDEVTFSGEVDESLFGIRNLERGI